MRGLMSWTQAIPRPQTATPGAKALPFKTIGRAVRDLKPGDVVLIQGGIYRESVTIRASRMKKKPDRHKGLSRA
ncbi:MAG TPA: hypothetical protein EYP65_07640 [Armatimonadetes bacterium]|nr:hypothetical protein [Armatimonadota bacterium]